MRTISVVTVARSDYGIYLPVLRKLQAETDVALQVIVASAHLTPEFGRTVTAIERDGFAISDRVEMLLSSDSPEAVAKSTALGMMGFAQSFARSRPDILVVLGDRFDMYAAAIAALPFNIPVAHIHGGEVTEGAIDDALRHSITKLSHLHFVATKEYARRVLQLGEESWRVVVSGAPALDHLQTLVTLSRKELETRFGLTLQEPPVLVTFHPVTLEFEQTEHYTAELLAALEDCVQPIIFTMPNADTYGRTIRRMIKAFVAGRPRAQAVDNLGTQGYFSLMACAAAMVGNSSSGIVEAPSFRLPVLNIGNRQRGRLRAANVIDVGYGREEIVAGLRRALNAEFRLSLAALTSPFGAGRAAEIISNVLRTVPLNQQLIQKRFVDAE